MSGPRIATAPPAVPPAAAAAELLKRPEVRDALAWMRLLLDPQDAAAVVRALSRPPVEMRHDELARVIQIARRRKLDLVVGLGAATESPQVPPEARDRIRRFLELHRGAARDLERLPGTDFLGGLLERLHVRSRPLLSAEEEAARRASLELLRGAAAHYSAEHPQAGARELARHLSAAGAAALAREAAPAPAGAGGETQAAGGQGGATGGEVRDRAGGEPQGRAGGELAPGAADDRAAANGAGRPAGGEGAERPAAAELDEEALVRERLEITLRMLREEVLGGVARIGERLGELRLDTELDVAHGVVRYLELLKLAALLQRPDGQSLEQALQDVNARLIAATTPLEREILLTSPLDETLLGSEPDERARALAVAPRDVPSLGPFLPRKGAGLALSASDIETYRSCPLRYKYARVLRIPTEPTVGQRFGIAVHQVLERFHSEDGESLVQLLELFEVCWRRSGLGEAEAELHEKGVQALRRYHVRLAENRSEPVWFERAFSFRLGPHHLRGRVDRVDRLAGEPERYELIDYKTSRPKSAEDLREDVQLSLYALAAREDWHLPDSIQSYYYVLDDLRVPVPSDGRDPGALSDLVMRVGEGILAQDFEPTPSPAACRLCDYRIVCPAAEV